MLSASAWSLCAATGSTSILSASRSASEEVSGTSTGPFGAATMASVIPSERTLRHRTVSMMAKPGKRAAHQ